MVMAKKRVCKRLAGVTVLELMIVLSIIGILLALLLPAVQVVRERARETVCKNNLHQLNLGIAHYFEIHKKLPPRPQPGQFGGWSIEVLPFIEQKNLGESIQIGSLLETATEMHLRQPRIMRCPNREILDKVADGQMHPAHYVLVPLNKRESYMVFESPLTVIAPWANGMEMSRGEFDHAVGPHHKGLFYASGFQQGVGMLLDGQPVQERIQNQ